MSMSTHVVGFRPADAQWNKMKAVWEACVAANILIPDEVADFFDGESPDDKLGAEVNIECAVEELSEEGRAGYTVDLTKLPPNVKVIRFYNSW